MSERQKTALVCGAGGFIGSHMVRRLKSEGYWVRGVDIKRPEYSPTLVKMERPRLVADSNIASSGQCW